MGSESSEGFQNVDLVQKKHQRLCLVCTPGSLADPLRNQRSIGYRRLGARGLVMLL